MTEEKSLRPIVRIEIRIARKFIGTEEN